MTAYLCDISTGQVYDNLSIKDDGTPGDPDKVALSYNQGTFMAAAWSCTTLPVRMNIFVMRLLSALTR